MTDAIFGFPVAAGQAAHDAARMIAEAARQAARAVSTCQAESTAADVAYYRKLLASAVANAMPVDESLQALSQLGAAACAPPESYTRVDNTPLALIGGRYTVEVAATFGEGAGPITLLNANDELFCSFSENGAATADLPAGTYRFELADAADATLTIITAVY